MINESIFNILKSVCLTNDKVSNARIASAIVYKNRIISFGINSKKSHPFQKKFAPNQEAIFLHSEIDAIKNALKCYNEDIISKSSLYICRIKQDQSSKSYKFGLAKPCIGCQRAISTFNIRKVFYTLDSSPYFDCL